MTREKFEKAFKESVVNYYNEHTDREKIDENNYNKFLTVINRKDTVDFYRTEIRLTKEAKNLYIGIYDKKKDFIHFNVYTLSDYKKIEEGV